MSRYRTQGEPQSSLPVRSVKSRALRWLVGWVLLPSLFLAGLFVSGMHWGARHPDSQWVSLTRWVATRLFDEDPQLFVDPLTDGKNLVP